MKIKLIKDVLTDFMLLQDKTIKYLDRQILVTYIQCEFPTYFKHLEYLANIVFRDKSKMYLFKRALSNLARVSAGNKLIQSIEKQGT